MNIIPRFTTTDFSHGRGGQPIQCLCLHITDGDSALGAIQWWARPEVEASAHYVVDSDGTIFQCVDEKDTAWTNGVINRPDRSNPFIDDWIRRNINPNRATVTTEIVGRPGRVIPAVQWRAVVALQADIAARRALPVVRERFIGHYQIDSVNRARCPSFSGDQWGRLLREVSAIMTVADPINAAFDAYKAQNPGLGANVFRGQITGHAHWTDWAPQDPLEVLWCERGVLGYVDGTVVDVTGWALTETVTALGSQLIQYGVPA